MLKDLFLQTSLVFLLNAYWKVFVANVNVKVAHKKKTKKKNLCCIIITIFFYHHATKYEGEKHLKPNIADDHDQDEVKVQFLIESHGLNRYQILQWNHVIQKFNVLLYNIHTYVQHKLVCVVDGLATTQTDT